MKSRILVVEDEEVMAAQLKIMLEGEGYEVATAENGRKALEACTGREKLVITDMKMPVMDGMELVQELKKRFRKIPVVMITAHATVKNAVEAMKQGAVDYITKPYDPEEIFAKVRKIIAHQKVLEENVKLKTQLEKRFDLREIVGQSRVIREMIDRIKLVAPTRSAVLIEGPSGTGKELVAKAIHYLSERKYDSFVVVNCAAIPETLLETELFGHKKGSFTDAKSDRKGCFEEADGGTIFLDEIGDMSLALQAKILRVLQEKEFMRVGESKTRRVDVRVVAATNKNVREEIHAKRFREDLYFRLNVINIKTPPLTDRRSDIPVLVRYFIKRFNHEIGRRVLGITDQAMERLVSYSWPGNVRELENMIEKAVIMTQGEMIDESVIERNLEYEEEKERGEIEEEQGGFRERVERFERKLIERALSKTRGRMSQAARELGISRHSLRYQMMKLGMTVFEGR